MSQNLFEIQSIRVFKQHKVEQFNWFQRFILKIIRVTIPEKYDVEFSITLSHKSQYLKINQIISLGNEASPFFRIISEDPRRYEDNSYRIIPNRFMSLVEIKHQLNKDSGFIMASMVGENSFKRVSYGN